MSVKLFFVLAICLQIAIETKASSDKTSSNLTDEQIRRIFHRSRSELPSYRTVKIQTVPSHRSKRDLRPVEFEIDDKKIRLDLNPLDYDVRHRETPVWTVETDYSSPSQHSYEKLKPEEYEIDGIFYEDPSKMATLLAYYKNNNVHYDGVFGQGWSMKVVRSIIENWYKPPGDNDHHVIFDADQNGKETEAIGENENRPNGEKLDKPLNVIYPKLLLVVSYDYFELFGKDVAETVKYVTTFWNAVNLRYKSLTEPQVKIVITGIIIAKDQTALRYFYDSFNQNEEIKFDHFYMLTAQGKYFANEFHQKVNFKNYDSVITMTTFNNNGVIGTAYIGGICSKSRNAGFVMDDASFKGLHPATHELGHLLYLPHDSVGRAADCPGNISDNVSTIMAEFATWDETVVWSKCSKKILREFAQSKAAECMRYPSRA